MKKAPNTSLARDPSSARNGESLGGGWSIKEWKSPCSPGSAHHITGPIRTGPGNVSDQTACVSAHSKPPQRRRWRQPLGVLGGMGAAAIALIMMAWASSSNVSQPANAAIQSSSVSIHGQKTGAQQIMRNEGYQLYLGAYPSELGARLLWAGLEADSGTMLVGLDPLFERSENEQGTFYNVYAGTLSNHEEADRHCDWLREQNIVCSILGG